MAWGASRSPRPPRPLSLRIDVDPGLPGLEAELAALHDRLHRPGDRLHGIERHDSGQPGLILRTREADGEYYVYVEDTVCRRLAGYTVFNRLVELDRRADRCLRAPHSRYAPAYQRRGLASALYRQALASGLCLLSGARQSPGAHALWVALARQHECVWVDLRDRRLRLLGAAVPAAVRDDLHTRMLLLGSGWSLPRLAACAGLLGVTEG
ncbi:MAG: N-acetyltransferase [Burkholderiaceae bacterium]|nr:N-acetyltransferase [Burkholderiaceae bacterium]